MFDDTYEIPHTSLVNTYWPLPATALSSDLKPQLERMIHDRDMISVYKKEGTQNNTYLTDIVSSGKIVRQLLY